MRVERCASPGAEWDAFVEGHAGATLAHAAAWARVVREAYGLEPHYLVARDDAGALAGVLPLVRLRNLRGALELVSMPYLDTGGVLAREADAEIALLEAAFALAREAGARAIDLRQPTPLRGRDAAGFSDRVDLALPLAADPDAQWSALSAKVRNQTRKAEREGLSLVPPERASAARFLAPFRVNMRDLGSPVHADAFFEAMQGAFGDRLRFVITELGERPVGGLVAIHYGGIVTIPWASTLRAERARCPNNQIYWEAIRWAVSLGARELDFGRSPRDAGTYRFKLGWGAQERPLAWVRFDAAGRPLPVSSPRDHGALERLSRLWTRLPVKVASLLGPRIRRRISS